ncbi:MAG: Cytosolic copper metallochaperone [Trichoglossum hirsutum]|nr:MAG: Cytosolic copper metallochaperone [Trichoglossum hirsutum]
MAEEQEHQHHYKFNIVMSCGGCSGAIDRVLKKLDGVEKYEVSLEKQTADVYTERLDYDTVLKTIRKTGKKVISGEADGKEASVDDSKVAGADEPAIVTGAE